MLRLFEITGTIQADELMKSVLQTAMATTNMELGTIRQYSFERNSWVLLTSSSAGVDVPREIPHSDILARSMASGTPTFIRDTEHNGSWAKLIADTTDPARAKYLCDIRCSVHIPMRLREKCHALILLDSASPRAIGEIGRASVGKE